MPTPCLPTASSRARSLSVSLCLSLSLSLARALCLSLPLCLVSLSLARALSLCAPSPHPGARAPEVAHIWPPRRCSKYSAPQAPHVLLDPRRRTFPNTKVVARRCVSTAGETPLTANRSCYCARVPLFQPARAATQSKHPQLQYESRLYKLLEGGGTVLSLCASRLVGACVLLAVCVCVCAGGGLLPCSRLPFAAGVVARRGCLLVPGMTCRAPRTADRRLVQSCAPASWHPAGAVVWCGGGLQRHGDGTSRPQLGRPLQLLLAQIQRQNGPFVSRSAGKGPRAARRRC